MPNLPPTLGDDDHISILSTSAMSSSFSAPADRSSSQRAPSTLDLNAGRSPSTSISSLGSKAHVNGFSSHNNLSGLASQEEGSSTRLFTRESEPREPLIPTIATISPPPESNPSDTSENRMPYGRFPNKLSEAVGSSRGSLRLPEVRFHHRLDNGRDGDSSVSSEESERDDTSGVSDGDTSAASAPQSVNMRRPRRSSLPRSKQVIYRRALKRYLIARPPPLLVIHLKRFQQVSKSPVTLFGNLKKLDDYVPFPEYLDIRPFLAPKKEDYGLGKGELKGKVVEKGRREEDQPCIYRLYSVVVHIGNMVRTI
jgi:Ubiquitin carboxyl-terminal hydrolase